MPKLRSAIRVDFARVRNDGKRLCFNAGSSACRKRPGVTSLARRTVCTCLCIGFCMTRSAAHAQECAFFFQAPPTNGNAASASDLDYIPSWSQYQMVANPFTLAHDTHINRIRWWGWYGQGNPINRVTNDYPFPDSNFTLRVFNDNEGKPGSLIYNADGVGGCGRTLVTNGSSTAFQYEHTLDMQFLVAAGQNYWLSVVDNTVSFPTDVSFYWSHTIDLTTNWAYTHTSPGTGNWGLMSAKAHAFELFALQPPQLVISGVDPLAGTNLITLTCTNNGAFWTLEGSTSLTTSTWSTVSTLWENNVNRFTTTIPGVGPAQFYRLRGN